MTVVVEPQFRWIPAMRRIYSRRIARYEAQVEQRYPGLLDQLAAQLPTIAASTPAWCPLPISAVIAMGVPPSDASAATAIAAFTLASRHVAYVHQGVALDPVDHVPVEQIKRLPVRALYLATSDADGQPPNGFFVWLEYDEREDRTEVRMQLDLAEVKDLWDTLADPVHVVRGSLRDAVSATQTTALSRSESIFGIPMPPVGRGTDLDRLIEQKTVHQAHLLAAVAHLTDPTTHVIDAMSLTGEGSAQQWTEPHQGQAGVTVWLAN